DQQAKPVFTFAELRAALRDPDFESLVRRGEARLLGLAVGNLDQRADQPARLALLVPPGLAAAGEQVRRAAGARPHLDAERAARPDLRDRGAKLRHVVDENKALPIGENIDAVVRTETDECGEGRRPFQSFGRQVEPERAGAASGL